MSYVSILLPAFYFNTTDRFEIIKALTIQFDATQDLFDLININTQDNNTNYAVKFKEINLSLSAIDELIYQRNCIKSICEKTFESLQAMTTKLTDVEKEFKIYLSKKDDDNLINDNIKLKEVVSSQLEISNNFRQNTEKALNKIKDDFQTMVQELETIRKKAKPTTQREGGLKSTDNSLNKKKGDMKGNGIPKLNFNK